jgi:predicted nucleic acid-binding protein
MSRLATGDVPACSLFVQLRAAGTPIPDNDLWTAALALENDLVLITRDQHFERIPQLLRQ